MMTEDDEDARLVAYIDGELDNDVRAAIEERLKTDADLRERLMRLREGDRPFVSSFEALLDRAPVERLQASLAEHVARQEARRTSMRDSWTLRTGLLTAAAAVLLFCAGVVTGLYGLGWFEGPTDEDEDWRQSVVEYAALYTPDTFASEPASQAKELASLGAKLGLPLTPERIALANLEFKGAQILSFQGAPLGELGYLGQARGVPVLFCIIRDSEPNGAMKTETRGEFAVASWARDGRGYMVIGKLPAKQIAEFASSLEQRF